MKKIYHKYLSVFFGNLHIFWICLIHGRWSVLYYSVCRKRP